MKAEQKKVVYVIGHKNPDTDSVCSAIGYAHLKSVITGDYYLPRIASNINSETRYVLKQADVKIPEILADVRTQVKDIEITKTKGVSSDISLRAAWQVMKNENLVTLPIIHEKKLEGLITVGDIARTYMEVYENNILAQANTQYESIRETLNGSIVIGDGKRHFNNGRVVIGTANPEMMESSIQKGDMVILGNRYEAQLCAIEMNAACIIICEGSEAALTIQKLAAANECMVITTPYDTYTVARQINQSMPIHYFMKDNNILSFHLDEYIDDINSIMASKRYRYFPVLNESGEYVGLISRRNVLNACKKKLILVDHNEKNQAVDGVEEADILEIIDHHRIGNIETIAPIIFRNQPIGCTASIIYQMYAEYHVKMDSKIAKLLCSAIISDTLMFCSPTSTTLDREAAEEMAKIANIDIHQYANELFQAGSDLEQRTDTEIIHQDFKKFRFNQHSIGIGQISSMSNEELKHLEHRIKDSLSQILIEDNLEMIYFMLTNIPGQFSRLMCVGNQSTELMEKAFEQKAVNSTVQLKGVVSRKKQVVPKLIETINSL